MVDHTIVHFEIPAKDVEKLRKFYAGLFGWKIEKFPGPMEYWGIETAPTSEKAVDEKGMPISRGVNGGMYKKEKPDQIPLNYYAVESVDDYVKKIKAMGGKIIHPTTEVPGIGWEAVAVDPEGNTFAIFQNK